ncbi:leucine-rich repeat-containing protein 41 isoform X2 [Denticeps clupeoides]|uniref:leucine-rich repeat-containing protein 41 isoform X2 n=1 Tax=Denticeps clupeoides TaxID=299321 RepID=UPI0010A2F4C4|nr:leucine-rich repeat-containing protein 41 isoform X2 [Denticeps clupeoides]
MWFRHGAAAHPDHDWKQKCLERLFHMALYSRIKGEKKYLSQLSEADILSITAKHVHVLSLFGPSGGVCRLASEELHPTLSVLEQGVRCIKLQDGYCLVKHRGTDLMYLLHRLLDHGSVKEVVVHRRLGFELQTWITTRCRGPDKTLAKSTGNGLLQQRDLPLDTTSTACHDPSHNTSHMGSPGIHFCVKQEGEMACKRRRLSLISRTAEVELHSQFFKNPFLPSCGPVCPEGQITSLDMEVTPYDIAHILSPSLPFWLCLQSLQLHIRWADKDSELLVLVSSLQALCKNPACSLLELSINVAHHTPMEVLLEACPTLKSLSLEICSAPGDSRNMLTSKDPSDQSVFSLETLYVKSFTLQMDLESFCSALKRAPSLTSVHISGIHPAPPVLHTLSESNRFLKVLTLHDVNLANCHSEILQLLENLMLEELCFKNCRLFDKCPIKEDFLRPFVSTLKGRPSLQSLALPQNRLAKSVIELADLFVGSAQSRITTLDLSSNFILAADLLELSTALSTNRPSQTLTLDLRLNPLDRDPEVKGQAFRKLFPFCKLVTDQWDSRTSMADHISVM